MSAPAHTVCAITPDKQRHANRSDAQAVADRLNHTHRGRQATSVYRCPCGCGAWFVTHKAAKARAQRAAARRRSRWGR